MTESTASVTDLSERLGRVLRCKVEGLVRLSGGASRETWSFDTVDLSTGTRRELILRRDPPYSLRGAESAGEPVVGGGMELEARLLGAAARAGVPVPAVRAAGPAAAERLVTGYLVMDRIGGQTIARKIRPDWIKLAQDAIDFIRENLTQNGRLLATCKTVDGKLQAHLNAYLDDYAFLLDALLELLQTEYRAIDLEFAGDLAEALLQDFETEAGGFYFTSHSHEALIHRPKQPYDNATPSGNGIAAVALQRLGHILGEPRYLQSAERTLKAFDNSIARNPAACASLSHALQEYLTPPKMVILRGNAQDLTVWKCQIIKQYQPHTLFLYLDEAVTNLPPSLQRKLSEDVNAWICQGVSCAAPINNLKELLEHL